MAAEKTVNYTPEMTVEMLKAYADGVTVEVIASNMGKTVRSVVAKLSREGVYRRKEYVSKTGETPIAKEVLADRIGAVAGLSDGEMDSLTKANKGALVKILAKLEA